MEKRKPQSWALDDLLPEPGSPESEQVLADIEARVVEFETLRESLSLDMSEEAFLAVLKLYEALYADLARVFAYAYLWFSEDTANQDALAFRARMEQFSADIQNRTLFFSLWWKALPDAAAERLIAPSGDLCYYLESLRRFKPHTLSEPEERIINIKDVNGISTVVTIYDMLTNGFKFYLMKDGEKKEFSRAQLMSFATGPDPEMRAACYQELYRVYGEYADVLTQIYASRVRDWYEENVRIRHFTSPVSVRNLQNDIPDPVVDTLLDVIRQNNGLFQRFFRFKAEQLGVECLRRYDIYAPLSDAEKHYDFYAAMQMVEASYRAFSPELADKALQVLDQQHMHAELRARKMDGAYCYSPLPHLTPWVLLNYTGKVRDVSTLAHELGHAIHGMMAAEHSPLTFHAPLPLAETASVFGEMLLTDKLLAEEKDPALRRTLLSSFLDDAYATITRQGYFVLFEKQAHQMIKDGATADQMHKVYMENLKEQFGDAVELSDDFRFEWLAIPHIYHTPFYCYAYAFGNLLVLALYRKYRELGQEFVPDYLRILAYGGSASPEHIISEAGFDMSSPEFWQGGFDLLAEMMEELEKLS